MSNTPATHGETGQVMASDGEDQEPGPTHLGEGDSDAPATGLTEHAFTLREAAAACGVSVQTIKRRKDDGLFPNARQEPIPNGGGTKRWVIPLSDLLAQGLHPNAARKRDGMPKPDLDLTDAGAGDGDQATKGEVEQLRQELARARQEAAVAKALADERLRALDDARLTNERQHQAMMMLNAGSAPEKEAPPLPEQRRRWWSWG